MGKQNPELNKRWRQMNISSTCLKYREVDRNYAPNINVMRLSRYKRSELRFDISLPNINIRRCCYQLDQIHHASLLFTENENLSVKGGNLCRFLQFFSSIIFRSVDSRVTSACELPLPRERPPLFLLVSSSE